jgi:hypothetical protein
LIQTARLEADRKSVVSVVDEARETLERWEAVEKALDEANSSAAGPSPNIGGRRFAFMWSGDDHLNQSKACESYHGGSGTSETVGQGNLANEGESGKIWRLLSTCANALNEKRTYLVR